MDYIKAILARWNQRGVQLPMICDPLTGKGSVSLTLLFISSIWVQLSLIGKVVTFLGGLDSEAAIYWFLSCAALYFGRKLSGNKKNADLGAPDNPQPTQPSRPETVINVNPSSNTNVDSPD